MGVGNANCTSDPNEEVATNRLLDAVSTTLTEEQEITLDSPFFESEFVTAINSMSPHKTPGPDPDGMTAAFYQIASDSFAKILLRVFSYQLSREVLLPEQRKSLVALLHKKGSRSVPGNYRPIQLIQVDVKILSGVLTGRFHKVVLVLVDPDQKGFVRGHHHIAALRDLQHLCTSQDTAANHAPRFGSPA